MALLTSRMLAQLERMTINSRGTAAGLSYGRGKGKTLTTGSGLDFVDVRDYAPGDDVRAIDWNLSARSDKLLVRQFRSEQEHDVHILFDASASMSTVGEDFWQRAKTIAAAIGYIGLSALDRIAIWPLRADDARGPVDRFALAAGRNRLPGMLQFLDNLPTGGSTDLTRSVEAFCRLAPTGGVAILISDFLDGPGATDSGSRGALRRLRTAGFQLHVVALTQEERPSGRLQLVDAESGDRVRATVNKKTRERYKQLLDAHLEDIAGYTRANGGAFVRADLSRELDTLIMRDLRREGLCA